MPRNRPAPGFTPAGRKLRHRIAGHMQQTAPTLEELCRLPGIVVELPSGAIVTSDGSGVPSDPHGDDTHDSAGGRRDGDAAVRE